MRDASLLPPPSIQNCMRALGVSYCSHIGKQVYLVDSPLYGKVAVKFAVSTLAKSQLQTESKFLARFSSSYWPRFIDTNSHQQVDWLMYAFVKGKPMTEEHTAINIDLISKLEAGLQSIHATGFIHADVKPANILNSNGKPTFIDLGSVLPIGQRYVQQSHSSVSPSFASINALLRQGVISTQDDYVSLAISLQSLSGRHPYQGLKVSEFALKETPLETGLLPAKYQIVLHQQVRLAKQLAAWKSIG